MLWYHIFEIGIFLLHVSPIKTGSYVTVLHVSNVVNLEIVLRSNENVVSVHKCALDCKTIDGKSFYYDGAGFVCHCNTQKDHGIQVRIQQFYTCKGSFTHKSNIFILIVRPYCVYTSKRVIYVLTGQSLPL